MAKNRKTQSAAIRFAPALKAFLLCAFIGGSAVGFVWQKNQIDQLSQEIKTREIRLAELIRQNKMRRDQFALLISPLALEARVKKLNLDLMQPPLSQIVHLIETEPAPVSTPDELYAGQRSAQIVP